MTLSGKAAFRLGAVGLAGMVIIVAAMQTHRDTPAKATPAPPSRPASQAGHNELARCQALGADGAEEPDCLRAWEQQRRRFLGLPSEKGR
nr:putative entry exclusion protein TrbK-alt [Caulobacter hibisci]